MKKNINGAIIFLVTCVLFTGIFGLSSCGKKGLVKDQTQVWQGDDLVDVAESAEAVAEKTPDVIYVDVEGAVKVPGVYELDEGARVFEAIDKAGGLKKSASTDDINQAKILDDGEKIIILTKKQAKENEQENAASAESDTGDNEGRGLIDINSADTSLLSTLPGIGDSKASAIVAYREDNGAFSAIEDIKNVSGIGDATFGNIKDLICVN